MQNIRIQSDITHVNGIWRNKPTALAVPFFGAVGQGHNIMLGKHPGFVTVAGCRCYSNTSLQHPMHILYTCTFSQKYVLFLLMPENKLKHIFSYLCFAFHITVSKLYFTVCRIIHSASGPLGEVHLCPSRLRGTCKRRTSGLYNKSSLMASQMQPKNSQCDFLCWRLKSLQNLYFWGVFWGVELQ